MGWEMRQGGGIKEGVCVSLYWSADATWEALKAMAGQASLPAPFCGPSIPSVHATSRKGEGERGVGGGGGIRL